MRRLIGVLSCWALLLWSCAGGTDPEDQVEDSFSVPPRPGASVGAKSFAPGQAAVSGRLIFDDIEGGCSYLEASDGARYEVIYPDGWTVDQANAELRGPAGEVARAGDPVSVRGTIAGDRTSICQIGRIFVATEVDTAAP